MSTVRIQVRRGTASQWTSVNPILAAGEMGLESDTNFIKFGDGVHAWSDLVYANEPLSNLQNTLADYVQLSDMGVANGVATLNSSGKVPSSQLDSSSFTELAQDAVASAITAGSGILTSYNDAGNAISISADTSVLATKAELAEVAQDSINDALIAGSYLTKTYNDGSNTLTLAVDSSAVAELSQDSVNEMWVSGTGIKKVYDDSANTFTVSNIGVLSVSGTNNQVSASTTNGVTTLSLPSTLTAPGNATITGDLSVNGNLNVLGTNNRVDTTTLVVENNTITLNMAQAGSPALNAEIIAHRGTSNPTKIIWDEANSVWKFTNDGSTFEPIAGVTAVSSQINTAQTNAQTFATSADSTLHTTITNEITTAKSQAITTSEGYTDTAIATEVSSRNNAIANAKSQAISTAQSYTDSATTTEISARNTAIASEATSRDAAISTHSGKTTSVHGITDTANLVYTSDSRLSDTRTPIDSSVTSAKIAANAVTTSAITDLNITTAKIADSAVTSAKIADGAIVNADINATAAIAATKIAGTAVTQADTGTVTSTMIADGTIATGDIADGAITTAKQADSSITTAKIADSAITSAKIADGTIATADIADSAITSAKIADGTIVDADINASAAIATSKISGLDTALSAKLPLAGGTMTGALTLSGAPTADSHAATKAYVDGIASGINFHAAVKAATSINISTTYANGTNGYGATLTADANGAMGTVDGQTLSVGDRVLVKSQTDAKQNGIYVVTSLGGASSKWVMTRAADADNNPNGEVSGGDFCFVTTGTLAAGSGYILSGSGTLTIGTDNLNYVQFNAAQAITAGSGLTKNGSTLSISTGAVTSNMILDGTIVDADINDSAAIAQSKISGLATSLAAKAPLASPTFTGTVTIPTGASITSPTMSGTVTYASGGLIQFSDGTQQSTAGVASLTTIGAAISANINLSSVGLSARDQMIPVAGTVNITIPANATTAYPVGTSIDFYQASGSNAAFVADSGVTFINTPGLKMRATGSVATAMKVATNAWLIFGDLSA
jgi:hypothetical protein